MKFLYCYAFKLISYEEETDHTTAGEEPSLSNTTTGTGETAEITVSRNTTVPEAVRHAELDLIKNCNYMFMCRPRFIVFFLYHTHVHRVQWTSSPVMRWPLMMLL